MTGKRDVGKEEMLDYLGRWKHCSQADQCSPAEMMKCIEVEDAIRAAIEERGRLREKIEEWKKRADEVSGEDYGSKNLIEEIRDFKLDGEEEK